MNPINTSRIYPGNGQKNKAQSWQWILLLSLLLGSILGCNLVSGSKEPTPNGFAVVQTQTAQAVQQVLDNLNNLATQTAQAAQSTVVLTPSPSAFPSPSPSQTPISIAFTDTPVPSPVIPPANPPGLVNKIRFRIGGTSAYFQKSISFGESHVYNLRALRDQTLIVSVTSPDSDVYLDVKGLGDGKHLVWSSEQVSDWYGTLPTNQVYQITLTTDNPDTYYFLLTEVPANIRFDPGAYSDTIGGYIDVDTDFHPEVPTRVRYLAYAFGGQTMTVKLTSPDPDDISLGISGQQVGQEYLSYEVKNTGGELILPSTQGYYLDVYAVKGISTAFTLEITIK